MEFLDEDARPRFLLQSKPLPQTPAAGDSDRRTRSLDLLTVLISFSISIPLLALSLLHFTFEPLSSILLWISISLLIGPFAPLSVTAGDIRVGLGHPLQLDDPEPEIRKPSKKSAKSIFRKSLQSESGSTSIDSEPVRISSSVEKLKQTEEVVPEEKEWSEGDVELLKKLLGKHPVGKPGRWEAIAEGFNGRHRVEGVIKQAKELGEKRMNSASDSYQKFLKDRKQIDGQEGGGNGLEPKGDGNITWTGGEDLALLNALKAFPKEAPMRWEKISAAVPGKGKAACMKRVTELKRDFRSSKAAVSSSSFEA